jgi:hypothetical protein
MSEISQLRERTAHYEELLKEVAMLRSDPGKMTLGKCSDHLLSLCDANGGTSYGTWHVNRDNETWSMTIQFEGGKTPTQNLDNLRTELETARTALKKWKRIRKPTHGSCCTCQALKSEHDSSED